MSRRTEEELRLPSRALGILVILVITLIAVSIIAVTTTYSIGISQVGILVNTYSGEVSGPVAGPTTQFFAKAPWVNLITLSTSVQTVVLEGNSTGVFVLSKDNLEIEFDINFRYQVNANHAIDLYRKYPSVNWQDSAIIPHIRAAFRDIVAGYPADQIQIVRDQIQAGVETELAFRLNNDTSLKDSLTVVATQITDITLPNSFLNAIQAKLNAQQALLQSQFDAQKLITLAQGQANATIAQAQGLAEAQIIQAMGTRNATIIVADGTSTSILNIASSLHLNSTQTATLTQTYVFMQQLQALCIQTNNPCQNMIMFIGNPGTGQIFELPVTQKP